MISVGYKYKKPELVDGFPSSGLVDIHSVSGCIAHNFTDYINYWKHNEWWLFNTPDAMKKIAASESIDLSDMTLFYYEVHEKEYNDTTNSWETFSPETSFVTPPGVIPPKEKRLEGFDVVCFSCGDEPECSPLSCNGLHEEIPVNRHCLFDSFDEAKSALESGLFTNCEPGPYRIFAVYTVVRFE